MIFTFNKRIYGYECDIYGHMNNANYLQLLEAARSEAMIDMNIPLSALKQQNIQFFVYRVELDYIKALDLEEVAAVKSWFYEMNRLKGRWHQEVFNSSGELCLKAELLIVFASEGKAKRLPVNVWEDFMQYIEPVMQA